MFVKLWMILVAVTCALSAILLAVALVLGFVLFMAGFESETLSERVMSFLGGGLVIFLVVAIVYSAAPLKRLSDLWGAGSD
ncbi:TPA: hypothetical protein L6B19_01070 [Pseudomonas aeruginosa]|nr:hypothetical protein PGPR2_00445 [Pseudomonas aeruginosa PGPR2]OWI91754.1 hypothetical protein CDC19_23250 [Pseudomonas aeruginosa]HBP5701115.1 hypothetical protein [Pseudomonas aeruginosa]